LARPFARALASDRLMALAPIWVAARKGPVDGKARMAAADQDETDLTGPPSRRPSGQESRSGLPRSVPVQAAKCRPRPLPELVRTYNRSLRRAAWAGRWSIAPCPVVALAKTDASTAAL